MKNIIDDINHLLYLKKELNIIQKAKEENPNLRIMSQQRADFLKSKNLPLNDFIRAPLDLKPYIENYEG